jgi:hypothetical protein
MEKLVLLNLVLFGLVNCGIYSQSNNSCQGLKFQNHNIINQKLLSRRESFDSRISVYNLSYGMIFIYFDWT